MLPSAPVRSYRFASSTAFARSAACAVALALLALPATASAQDWEDPVLTIGLFVLLGLPVFLAQLVLLILVIIRRARRRPGRGLAVGSTVVSVVALTLALGLHVTFHVTFPGSKANALCSALFLSSPLWLVGIVTLVLGRKLLHTPRQQPE